MIGGFILGLFIGVCVGVFITAMCAASRDPEDD